MIERLLKPLSTYSPLRIGLNVTQAPPQAKPGTSDATACTNYGRKNALQHLLSILQNIVLKADGNLKSLP